MDDPRNVPFNRDKEVRTEGGPDPKRAKLAEQDRLLQQTVQPLGFPWLTPFGYFAQQQQQALSYASFLQRGGFFPAMIPVQPQKLAVQPAPAQLNLLRHPSMLLPESNTAPPPPPPAQVPDPSPQPAASSEEGSSRRRREHHHRSSKLIQVQIPRGTSVEEAKLRIAAAANIPANEQVLIVNG